MEKRQIQLKNKETLSCKLHRALSGFEPQRKDRQRALLISHCSSGQRVVTLEVSSTPTRVDNEAY